MSQVHQYQSDFTSLRSLVLHTLDLLKQVSNLLAWCSRSFRTLNSPNLLILITTRKIPMCVQTLLALKTRPLLEFDKTSLFGPPLGGLWPSSSGAKFLCVLGISLLQVLWPQMLPLFPVLACASAIICNHYGTPDTYTAVEIWTVTNTEMYVAW